VTLIELIVFLINVAMGVAISCLAGGRYGLTGYIVGFPIGFVSLICVLAAMAWLDDMWRRGRPSFPVCRNGKCRAGEYRYSQVEGRLVCRCQCGTEYKRAGRRFSEVLPDGSIRPYLVWRAFRGWYPDDEANADQSRIPPPAVQPGG
jgi:hypothetical protein